MINRLNAHKQGKSVVEYMGLILVVAGALLVLQFFISRSFHGRYKKVGESVAYGRQWDRTKTFECTFTQINATYGLWYDRSCYYEYASRVCKANDYPCEDNIRRGCGPPNTAAYCCDQNEEPVGGSNCG